MPAALHFRKLRSFGNDSKTAIHSGMVRTNALLVFVPSAILSSYILYCWKKGSIYTYGVMHYRKETPLIA